MLLLEKFEEIAEYLIIKLKQSKPRWLTEDNMNNYLFNPEYTWVALLFVVACEIPIIILLIEKFPYKEVDWEAYMDQVKTLLNGSWDYSKFYGGTGPIAYPAGHMYVFSGFYYLTNKGTNIRLGRYIMGMIYMLTLLLVARIYHKTRVVPPYTVTLLMVSYRMHSLYTCRIFNDPLAMLLLYGSINCFISNKWTLGSILYSLGVSIKMNILLFAPGLLLVYMQYLGLFGTVFQLVLCGLVQVILGLPFLMVNAEGYLSRAFNFQRQFLQVHSMNWSCVPKWMFNSKIFHSSLLLIHFCVLVIGLTRHYNRMNICSRVYLNILNNEPYRSRLIVLILLLSNFIGISFARSLHQQFYSWYFHTLPFLLTLTSKHALDRILLWYGLEYAWNQSLAFTLSSLVMHLVHGIVILSLHRDWPCVDITNQPKKSSE